MPSDVCRHGWIWAFKLVQPSRVRAFVLQYIVQRKERPWPGAVLRLECQDESRELLL